jgi:hypothetical protein
MNMLKQLTVDALYLALSRLEEPLPASIAQQVQEFSEDWEAHANDIKALAAQHEPLKQCYQDARIELQSGSGTGKQGMNPCPSPLPRKLTEADAIALGALPHLEMPQMMLTEAEIKAIDRLNTALLDLKYWHTTALDHVNKQVESAQETVQALQVLTDLELPQLLEKIALIKRQRAVLRRPLTEAESIALIQTVRPETQGGNRNHEFS